MDHMPLTTQLLIDADFYLFRDCSAVEETTSFDGVNYILHCNKQKALERFMASIEGLEATLNADQTVLVFSGARNFRKDLWHLYKANRKATRKPLCYWDIIEDLKAQKDRPVLSEEVLEGDDYIGILATRPSPVDRIIVSDDKDMQTIPNVKIWRMGNMVETTTTSANHFWLLQTLMGDTTDGYKGCPGIGPKTAEKVLAKAGDPWENVLQAYRDGCSKKPEALAAAELPARADTPDDFALLNARLARILRFSDWDSKSRTPILWDSSTTSLLQ